MWRHNQRAFNPTKPARGQITKTLHQLTERCTLDSVSSPPEKKRQPHPRGDAARDRTHHLAKKQGVHTAEVTGLLGAVCMYYGGAHVPPSSGRRDGVCRVGSNGSISRDRRTVMCVGTLRFDGDIIPSIDSRNNWSLGRYGCLYVRRVPAKRNID